MRLHFRAPMGTRITDTERLVLEAERKIREIIPADELEGLNDNIGIPLSYNLAFVSTDNIGPQDAEILISLKPGHKPTARVHEADPRRAAAGRSPAARCTSSPRTS